MAPVSRTDAISYGLDTVSYVFGVALVSFPPLVVGALALSESIIGIVGLIVGWTLLTAGGVGLIYKVIADAVDKGMETESSGSDSD